MPESLLLTLYFLSDPKLLRVVRDEVKSIAHKLGCCAKIQSELIMAVNEACMNIMMHAYKGDTTGEIIMEVHDHGSELEFKLKDFGPPVDVAKIKPRDLDDLRPGGLGTFFMSEVMDHCSYATATQENSNGNVLHMRKKIH